jgi:hypothetical protein
VDRGSRSEATEALRGLVDGIVLTPDQDRETLQIELKGNLAAMLGATVQTKRSPESADLSLQVSLVAGARNPLNFGLLLVGRVVSPQTRIRRSTNWGFGSGALLYTAVEVTGRCEDTPRLSSLAPQRLD